MDLSLAETVTLGVAVAAVMIGTAAVVAAESRSAARLDSLWTLVAGAGAVILIAAVIVRIG